MSEDKKDKDTPPPQDGQDRGFFSGRRFRSSLVYLVLIVLVVLTLRRFLVEDGHEATFDEFLSRLRLGQVEYVVLGDDYHTGVMNLDPSTWWSALLEPRTTPSAEEKAVPKEAVPATPSKEASGTDVPAATTAARRIGGRLPTEGRFKFTVAAAPYGDLVKELQLAHDKFGTQYKRTPTEGFLSMLVMFLLPFALILGLWYLLMRQSGQMGRAALSFGKTRAKLYAEKMQTVTFSDVAGCEEAKEELQEVVEFLRDPKKYQRLGGRMPKGILLVGPPGTGKTLLARAIAGESKSPFFSLSGSDFVEMFVGVGAARVRDLFQQAKHRAPCIIFVDELDAVGRHRGAGLGGGHDEREQTLNQLLVEMDGFDTTQGVIFLAATNRPDVLDPALLRPGRFDRQVVIDAPDVHGRKAILIVHARNKPFAANIDFGILAANTPGFTGADLANVINESALLAARRNLNEIGKAELEEAVERAIAGPERKSRRLSEDERKRVAFHEAGHALVAALSKHADPVRKISIIPRGHAALGYTMQFPSDDRYLITRSALLDRLKGLLAGRAAELLIFGEVSSGAGDDLTKASEIARTMVSRLGMSDAMGPVAYGRDNRHVFLGRDFTQEDKNFSERTAELIDTEVKRIIDEASEEAKSILLERRACLEHLAGILLEKEVMQGSELEEIIQKELCCRPGAPSLEGPQASGEAPVGVVPDPSGPAPSQAEPRTSS